MKAYVIYFTTIISVFSIKSFGQDTKNSSIIVTKGSVVSKTDNTTKDDRVIVGYYVEETINAAFGKRVTKYEVSKLDMVYTNDLGPNNTRVVTPIYRKTKTRTVQGIPFTKTLDTVAETIRPVVVDVITPAEIRNNAAETVKPVAVNVIPPSEGQKYLTIDVVKTYAKVLSKGYKSIEMLTKVADRAYFEGDLTTAAKYYGELLNMNTKLDAMYYYRYAQSLKGINQVKKGEEMMRLFESKNMAYKVSAIK